MFKAKKSFLVGFSGGADSTAALLWIMESHAAENGRITAVHFNHHLRGKESDDEAAGAAKFAAECGVEFRLIDLDIAPGGNLEARARRARLDAWKKLCREYEKPVVVTGHHQDDCIENMFLRIGRGSNVSGLTGLQLYSEVEGVCFFRPLLAMSRAEIESFLRERGVDKWAVDSSNLECRYSRNVLRNKILPEFYELFPGGRKAVMQSYRNLQDDAACLDRMARAFYETAEDRFELSFWRLHNEPALTVRMLRLLCREFFNDDQPLSAAAVERFEDMVVMEKSGICVLDEKRQLRIAGNRILPVCSAPETIRWEWKKEASVRWGNWEFTAVCVDVMPEKTGLSAACFSAGELPETVEIGAPHEGETMVPFGRKSAVKVKDLRIKRKIPAFPVNPAVRSADGRVLWLPGIRHSGQFPVRTGDKVIVFYAKKNEEFC